MAGKQEVIWLVKSLLHEAPEKRPSRHLAV
jgi:hypothetical protein